MMDFFAFRWARRLRVLRESSRVDREMDEEMRFHVEMEAQELQRQHGFPAAEARRQAMIAFGGVERHKEAARDERWYGWVNGLSLDLKLGVRMLRKYKALSVIGGLGMAVGVAVAAGFFTFTTAFYYSHPPLDEGDRIVAIENRNLLNSDDWRATLFDFHTWGENLRGVQELMAFRRLRRSVEIDGAASPGVPVAEMTASGFRLARVAPLMGRPLVQSDEHDGAPAVVVIGHREWQSDFGADPAVLGKQIRLGGVPHTVVGVMPDDFRFPINHGYWTPLATDRSRYAAGEGPKLFVFGRLAPGLSKGSAQSELTALGERTSAELPQVYEHLRPAILPAVHTMLDVQQYPAWFMWALQLFGVLVLAVVAVNVAVLVYARTASRHGEITVRTALGAGRRRIVTQLFLEALALSSIAAAVGLLFADLTYRQFFAVAGGQHLPYWIRHGLPASAILYGAALAILTAVMIGVAPALRATGTQLQSSLRQLGGGTEMRMGRTWTTLIVAQVAIAVAALPVVVAIAVNTIWQPLPTPRFPAEEVLALRLEREQDPYSARQQESGGDFGRQQQELIRLLESEPGIGAVTYARSLPLAGERARLEVEGGAVPAGPLETIASFVDRDYFDVLGVSVLAGRGFEAADLAEGASAVIVNRTFVERFLGGADPLGRRVRHTSGVGRETDERSYRIVGVVDAMYEYPTHPDRTPAAMYRPLVAGDEPLRIMLRTAGATPAELVARVRTIATTVAPGTQLDARPMDTFYTGIDDATKAFMGMVVGLMTLSVLLLSAAGISALMSFAVTRRQREIGIRIALGAPRSRVMAAIFSRSASQITVGLVIGLAAGALLDRVTGGALMGGRAAVLLPFVAALMVGAGLLAGLGPARRALRIHPVEALRND